MKLFGKVALAAVLGASALALTATDASARIVCNQWGECWHVRNTYVYRPEFGLTVHEDNWRWGAGEHYRWHEHHGRGYWRNGVWIRF
ncbi:MAG: hypothetical protein ACREHE_05755 [Rhizomicrobium sp.]